MSKKLPFMSIAVDDVTMEEALSEIEQLVALRNNSFVVTPNVDHLVKLEKDAELRNAY